MCFLVRVRSYDVPTRIKSGRGRGTGWRDSTKWSPWKTVSKFVTYEQAEVARDAFKKNGLQQVVVFYQGKAYHQTKAHGGWWVRVGAAAIDPRDGGAKFVKEVT